MHLKKTQSVQRKTVFFYYEYIPLWLIASFGLTLHSENGIVK